MRRLKVTEAGAGQRADVFLSAKYPDFSRSSLEGLFDKGLVRRNRQALKAGEKLRVGDTLSVNDESLYLKPQAIDLPIVYEDEDVIVIDKPAGVLTHSKGAINQEATVASCIAPNIKGISGNRAGIVHRLDRATSGIIITAKTAEAQTELQKQFSKRKTKKTYMAVVEGWPEPAAAIIDAPIGRNPRRPQTFRVSADGKPAQTAYRTLEQFEKDRRRYALLELKPVTGRTHQLRVHLRYVGHPVIGDHLYGTDGDGLLLHAHTLEITLPNGKRQIFTAKIPPRIKDFAKDA